MYHFFLNIVLVLGAIAASVQAAKLALRAVVFVINLAVVTAILGPRAYAAAKAEAALPARDLALDFKGDGAQAKQFNTVVKDRLTRTRVAARHYRHACTATRLGRHLARAWRADTHIS